MQKLIKINYKSAYKLVLYQFKAKRLQLYIFIHFQSLQFTKRYTPLRKYSVLSWERMTGSAPQCRRNSNSPMGRQLCLTHVYRAFNAILEYIQYCSTHTYRIERQHQFIKIMYNECANQYGTISKRHKGVNHIVVINVHVYMCTVLYRASTMEGPERA